MIIDAHSHIIGSEDWWPRWAWEAVHRIQAARSGKTVEELAKFRKDSFDGTGDIFIENMDRAGVDKAIVCVLDYGLAVPGEDTRLPIDEINRLTYGIVKRHAHRLYFAVGVDPRRRNAGEVLEMGVKELGAKMLKLYPGTGWFPNDRIAYPLYEKCVDFGIPVNYHSGPVFGPMKSKYSHPYQIDEVAADFPDLTIYCTHCGHGSFMEMLSIARARPKIVCDMAVWIAWLYSGEGFHFYKMWRYIMNMLGPERLLFASDHTGIKFSPELKDEYSDWVSMLKHVPKEAGVKFTNQELSDFFSGNAIRTLNLN